MTMPHYKHLKVLFLSLYLIFGSYNAVKVGISHDEYHEQKNWEYNVKIFKKTFLNQVPDENLSEYKDKYYGVGFQFISQPIQFLIKDLVKSIHQSGTISIDDYGAKLISKHFVVFLFFFISGILFYLILKKIIDNEIFLSISSLIYLLYPYLFGHALFNPKDIPFLTCWMLCSYLSLKILEKYLIKTSVSFFHVFIVALSTAYLISIRVSGILIFLQYFLSFLILFNIKDKNLNLINFENFKKLTFFLISTTLLIYILFPYIWQNPLYFIDTIKHFGKFYHDVCTLTFGKCLEARSADPLYIPMWLSVKLPLIIIIGLFLIPFVEKKLFNNKKTSLYFGTFLGTAICIPLFLILTKAHLFDEIRHIQFLIPIFFIISLVAFFTFSKKFFYILSVLTAFIFSIELNWMHPYQYTWFNMPSRFFEISKNFETEYWGLSGLNLAANANLHLEIEDDTPDKPKCLLASPLWGVKPFLANSKFKCFGPWSLIDSDYQRPFYAIQNVRNLKKSIPYKCETIASEKYSYFFDNEEIIAGRVLLCK